MNLTFLFLIYMLGIDFLYIAIGLLLFFTNLNQRLGIRLLSMSVIAFWIVPYLCSCDCDRSCGNWTCPNYHKGS